MAPLPAALADALHDGIAMLDPRGGLSAPNAAMAELLAARGGDRGPARDLVSLGFEGADEVDLRAGHPITIRTADRHWQLRHVREGVTTWLLSHELTEGVHARSAASELLRLRALATAATTIVHDFNNLLNSCLGLAAHVMPLVADPVEQRMLQELGSGTQQGARLARAVARLLERGVGDVALVPAVVLLDEALAVAARAITQRGIRLTVERPVQSPVVRTVVAEAVQALWHALMAVVDLAPSQLVVMLDAAALGGGRARPCARVRIRASGLPPGAGAELARLVDLEPGLLARLDRSALAPGIAGAVFVLRHAGGELTANVVDGEIQLDCCWPAAR